MRSSLTTLPVRWLEQISWCVGNHTAEYMTSRNLFKSMSMMMHLLPRWFLLKQKRKTWSATRLCSKTPNISFCQKDYFDSQPRCAEHSGQSSKDLWTAKYFTLSHGNPLARAEHSRIFCLITWPHGIWWIFLDSHIVTLQLGGWLRLWAP